MKTQIIALEAHDDFISVRDRMSWAKSPRILLVWPKFEKIALRAADLRILQQHASYLGAEMGIITRRGDIRRDATRFGIPVFDSAAAAQRQAWPSRGRTGPKLPDRPRKDPEELRALRTSAHPGEARWRTRPLTRIGCFLMGVAAALTIAALFVPEAAIALTPESQQQSVLLPVTAGTSITAVSLAGSLPAHEITVTVNGAQAARVNTQSSIPDHKAQGIARFANLTQSDVTIPAGTIVYSITPTAVQFATLNDTHLPGSVNAIVEVPIAAVKAGASGNLPANAIQAIQGNLSLSAAVSNPEPTEGGTDRVTAAPSDADRKRVHDVLLDTLKHQAQTQITQSIGPKDLLLVDTLKAGQTMDEVYDPPAGQAGNLLKLTMRVDFTAEYVKADDLAQLAEAMLNASKAKDFAPAEGSLTFAVAGTPSIDDSGLAHFDLQVGRKLVHELDLSQANAMTRGQAPWEAANTLQARLPLAARPEIKISPSWWPWMPLIPFRITVTSVE